LPGYPFFADFAQHTSLSWTPLRSVAKPTVGGEIMTFDNDYGKPEPRREEIDRLPGPVLLEFGTGWCGYCQAIQGSLKALLESFPQVHHIKVEDGKGRPLGRSFHVKSWPNFVFLRDGQVVMQLARPESEEIRQGLEAITRS
jgi:thioredoxin 1